MSGSESPSDLVIGLLILMAGACFFFAALGILSGILEAYSRKRDLSENERTLIEICRDVIKDGQQRRRR